MQQSKMITKEMTMGEIIDKYPFAAEIMLAYGLHCVGCHVNPYESLENGALGHGMSESEIESMLTELNDAVAGYKAPEKKDSGERITITANAAKKVSELMHQSHAGHKALRIAVVAGGCSGKTYKMDFDEQKSNDFVFEEHGVKILVDPKSMEFLNGTNVDYVESLQGSGFKLDNPNAQSTCGCGKSVH